MKNEKFNIKEWQDKYLNESLSKSKMTKTILSEGSVKIGKIKVLNNGNTSGTSLYEAFDEKQNKIVSAWVDKHQDKIDVLYDMNYDAHIEQKYSETAIIQFASRMFTLYASYGVYRIGAGGGMSSKNVMDGILEKFVAACK